MVSLAVYAAAQEGQLRLMRIASARQDSYQGRHTTV